MMLHPRPDLDPQLEVSLQRTMITMVKVHGQVSSALLAQEHTDKSSSKRYLKTASDARHCLTSSL